LLGEHTHQPTIVEAVAAAHHVIEEDLRRVPFVGRSDRRVEADDVRRRAMTAVGDRHVDTELARRHGGAVSAQAAAEHEDIGARPLDREAHDRLPTWRHMRMKWVDCMGFSLTALPL
jgi:hypothetical protein